MFARVYSIPKARLRIPSSLCSFHFSVIGLRIWVANHVTGKKEKQNHQICQSFVMAQGSVALQMTLSRILASVVISFVFLAKKATKSRLYPFLSFAE